MVETGLEDLLEDRPEGLFLHREREGPDAMKAWRWRYKRQWIISLSVILILALAATIGSTSSSFSDPEASTDNINRVITNWYDLAWSYRKPITIDNSGSELTDYQVKVTVNTQELIAAGKMQPDGDDIRFTQSNGSTEIYYWIESGINTISTVIWVKVPSIPTGDSTIYMYYGNSAASAASSVANTFSSGSFADTFTDTSKINTSDSVNVEVISEEVRLTQIIQNPGFETEISASDWTYAENDPDWDGARATDWFTEGSWSYKLSLPKNAAVDGNSYCEITQDLDLTDINSLCFDAQVDDHGGDLAAQVLIDITVVLNNIQTGNNQTVDVSIYSGTHTLRVRFQNPGASVVKSTGGESYYRTDNWRGYQSSGILRSVTIPENTDTRLAVGTQLSWTDNEPVNTDIKYQLEYYDGAWALIPDTDLAGNSTGFDDSPIDISSIKTTYGQIRLRANLSTTDNMVTPSVQDWTVTYYYREYTSPEPTVAEIGGEE